MKNDYRIGDTKISIPPTLLFTAVAMIDDVSKVVSMDVKGPGHVVYVLGDTREELGGSEYLSLRGGAGGNPPQVFPFSSRMLYERLHRAMNDGLVASCHDVSDGGLGAALAETAFGGGFGMTVSLSSIGVEYGAAALFSETPGRFVAVDPEHAGVSVRLNGSPCYRIGETVEDPMLHIICGDGKIVSADLDTLRSAWKTTLDW